MPPVKRPIAHGYTLIEIVAVIAILAIVSAIAIPHLGPRDDVKTASAAREMTADLLFAQSQAIATGKTHYMTFDAAGYRVLDQVNPPHVILHPAWRTPYEIHLADGPLHGVTFAKIDFDGGDTLAFDPTGMPSCRTAAGTFSPLLHGSLELKCGSSIVTLTVEPYTGAINIR